MKTKNISGYKVEFDGADENGITQGSVSKGKYYGSIELATQAGHLHDDNWNIHEIPEDICIKIADWAEEVGY
jgi:hypothetical protein